ncbi:MAG: hypothetical protein J0I98_06685 [Mesorhizobium sp.]|nr:hypothetical protein [Mesorhizobium sp.]MBN9242461.1 hypothetical protein [Mesorhizobium sp.]
MISPQFRPATPAVPPSARPAAGIVERIADKIAELNRIDEGVSKEDLRPFFSGAELDRYAIEAADFHRARSDRQVA